ncbi:DNA-directed RNA polymerase subunit omega [Candidatus Cyrtobacter comes]|uniref:DNA-directed RNA polymerase subunit omega n=1 Tax=Candidatus Cyrtobacter comes TaxID=675776 RepID=A0ABU5L882_9RICK|nr:DNA-directed RNA polymerase subunit omega [Candidatus Cyrtobacter comes]MDZ5762338.1 DNA-directed RNA polymerase subunit omega [Candidatus Cyrtobacter comes]
MARVTVEDCLPKVSDRFELVIVASLRAKDIAKGSPVMITTGPKNEKSTILALREIASGLLDASYFDAKDAEVIGNVVEKQGSKHEPKEQSSPKKTAEPGNEGFVYHDDEENID